MSDKSVELSIVMPCLNEADTLGICIEKAQKSFKDHNINGEIIVADNGSTDASLQIANDLGVRIVHVKEKGYGSALRGGIAEANGKFIIMGDADDSYDFLDINKFVVKLREGYDLVQGCRLPGGGGSIADGAMPWSHRHIGNPMFTWMVRNWFSAPINDVYCGLRGFTKELYNKLELRCSGMEFATEMIIKTSLYKYKIAEVPITLHKDGRKAHAPHLKTFRDGWRTLRFFLLYSPRWLYLIPGVLLLLLGTVGYGLSLSRASLFGVNFEAHTLLFASLFFLMGYQSILYGMMSKTFAIGERLMPMESSMEFWLKYTKLEPGLIMGAVALLAGVILMLSAFIKWWSLGFGDLVYPDTLQIVIPGVTLALIGFQTILFSFFQSILRIHRI